MTRSPHNAFGTNASACPRWDAAAQARLDFVRRAEASGFPRPKALALLHLCGLDVTRAAREMTARGFEVSR